MAKINSACTTNCSIPTSSRCRWNTNVTGYCHRNMPAVSIEGPGWLSTVVVFPSVTGYTTSIPVLRTTDTYEHLHFALQGNPPLQVPWHYNQTTGRAVTHTTEYRSHNCQYQTLLHGSGHVLPGDGQTIISLSLLSRLSSVMPMPWDRLPRISRHAPAANFAVPNGDSHSILSI